MDEPQSFLHPDAIRKLIDELKKYPHHQYIIASHLPLVITASNPKTITVIRQVGAISDFQAIDATETRHLRDYLAEIGARLSDVFGADNILWVEGPTEERCFPMILERIENRPLMGTAIVAVADTGSLEGRHKERVLEIYERLSHSQSLLPPALGFIFDKEGRNEHQRIELINRSKGKLSFIPRRLYENYLLIPGAIAAVINQYDCQDDSQEREAKISVEQVQGWIDQHHAANKYYPTQAYSSQSWTSHIHGADFLNDLFNELTNTRVSFKSEKVTYSVALTQWLIENSPNDLGEIADFLRSKLDESLL